MAISWCRLWHELPVDPKWRVIGRKSNQPVSNVISVYIFMLVSASQNSERGVIGDWNDEDVAAALDIDTEDVANIREAMQGKVLDGDKVTGWEKRQPKREDDSAPRMQKKRNSDKVTQRDAHVTQCDAPDKDPDPDQDTDKDLSPGIPPPNGGGKEALKEKTKKPEPKQEPEPLPDPLAGNAPFGRLYKNVCRELVKVHPRLKLPAPGSKMEHNWKLELLRLHTIDDYPEDDVSYCLTWLFLGGCEDAKFWRGQVQGLGNIRDKKAGEGLTKFDKIHEKWHQSDDVYGQDACVLRDDEERTRLLQEAMGDVDLGTLVHNVEGVR